MSYHHLPNGGMTAWLRALNPWTAAGNKSAGPSSVIASEAKQSIAPPKESMDCFASLAMTN
jgi:hypothetical protein